MQADLELIWSFLYMDDPTCLVWQIVDMGSTWVGGTTNRRCSRSDHHMDESAHLVPLCLLSSPLTHVSSATSETCKN
jgi:hypothetical protein